MKAKEYLMQVKVIDSLINEKRTEVCRLSDLVLSTTSLTGGERVQSSGAKDRVADMVCKIQDLTSEIEAEIRRLIDKRNEIMKVIDQVEDADLVRLLYKRYLHFKSWEQIACEMGFTWRWVLKLHGKALVEVQKILDGKVQEGAYWNERGQVIYESDKG